MMFEIYFQNSNYQKSFSIYISSDDISEAQNIAHTINKFNEIKYGGTLPNPIVNPISSLHPFLTYQCGCLGNNRTCTECNGKGYILNELGNDLIQIIKQNLFRSITDDAKS